MYWFLPWVWTVSFLEGLFGGQEVVAAPLSEGDIDAAAEIHSQAFDQAWTGDELAAILAQDGTFGVVARRIGLPDDPPLGFVLARNTEGEAEILTIAVAKRARGAGVGRLLMDEILQLLHAARAESLFLEVDEENTPARKLYGRLRFEEVGRRPAYYRHPEGHRTSALTLKRALR
ncbi:GNAT family N-acetyltransferase [Aurantimonas coralicida]|uniref:GNAT family N-acetyltransferase n=1 Tax=Aurantimonas coralicida TaxID=182270 RepID=UPI001E61AADA|nr:GNAT family N-acetyltransferase [Aurantimonas coralicida]MCD1644974.1 GNAT family N-acetyltransferase [Aurantimonas coralicida]